MEPSSEANADLSARIRQQEVIADLGQRALEADDLDRLLHDASVAVAETLDNDYCAVFESSPDGAEAFVRAGVGWREGLVGTATVPTDADSQLGRTLDGTEPVIVEDFRADERFAGPEVLAEHDVVSGITALVGPAEEPWGLLGTYATDRRAFTEHDANFVQSVANVLASAIENERAKSEREEIYGRISDAFFALDEEWRFTHLNERAHEMINPDGRTLVGETIWEVFPEAVGRKFKSKYEHAMYEQETVSFEEHYPAPLDAWFEVRVYPSETGLSVYFRDVTDRREREWELQRTERRFEAIFEDPNILVGLLDPDGTVLDINQTAMEYIDADLDEVTGEPFWETPWWGEGDEVSNEVREWTERAAAGEYVNFEADLIRPDGERYSLEGVFRPVTNADDEVVSIIVSDRDVTERREYERQLRESERRYRTLAESFPNGIVTLFDEDLRYTLAAGRAFEDLPVSRSDLEGQVLRDAWGDDVAEKLEPVLRAALDGEEKAVELSYVGREWLIHAVPITDEQDDVFGGMTMAQDITERKWFERTLTALHDSSRELLQLETESAVSESVLRTTTEVLGIPGASIYLYDEAESKLVPAASSEYVENLFDEPLPALGPDDTALTWQAFADGETITFDDVRRTDLTYRDDTSIRSGLWIPLGDHGVLVVVSEAVGAFGPNEKELADLLAATAETALDRVERERQRRRHERELEAQNERLDRFASMLAHELRNPVTVGQIYSQQLPDDADAEAVEYVTEAFDRIEDMIDVMLVLTRGRDAVDGSNPVDLAAAAREAWDDVDAPDATLEVAIDRTIRTDETYIRHLFKNLFDNAVEHGGRGVTVTVGELPTGFYVADDGSGIPADDRDAVFEAGYTTAAEQGGTGLGLAFVEELADVYEWDCTVTESAAGGARFEFTNVEFGNVE